MSRPPAAGPAGDEPRSLRLSKDLILAAALRLVDAESIESLTMRRLADELEVSAMGLYRHVRGRDEIIEGLANIALEALDCEPDRNATWDGQLQEIFEGVHRALLDHPGLIHILHVQPVTSDRVLCAVERILAILRGAGFDGEEAVAILASLQSFTFGFTVQQRARAGQDERAHVARLRALPCDEFPNTIELAHDFATWTSEEHFAYGMQLLLDGVRRQCQPDQ